MNPTTTRKTARCTAVQISQLTAAVRSAPRRYTNTTKTPRSPTLLWLNRDAPPLVSALPSCKSSVAVKTHDWIPDCDLVCFIVKGNKEVSFSERGPALITHQCGVRFGSEHPALSEEGKSSFQCCRFIQTCTLEEWVVRELVIGMVFQLTTAKVCEEAHRRLEETRKMRWSLLLRHDFVPYYYIYPYSK